MSYADINARFDTNGWLEALSFGRRAWGEVKVNSHVDVLVGGSAYRDGVDTLLHGISPRVISEREKLEFIILRPICKFPTDHNPKSPLKTCDNCIGAQTSTTWHNLE